MEKTKVAIVFGGRSSEHDVSCVSAKTVAGALDKEKYEVTFIGITKEGHWLLVDPSEDITKKDWESGSVRAVISPDSSHKLIVIDGESFWAIAKR